MPYKECEECNVQLVYTGETDSRQEWVEDNYGCPKCKALYIHRREFDQNGLVINDTFERDTSEDVVPDPKKEDTVREALGVEKKFEVYITIPISGTVETSLIVNAINEGEAKKRAVNIFQGDGVCDDGTPIEMSYPEYEITNTDGWEIDVKDMAN